MEARARIDPLTLGAFVGAVTLAGGNAVSIRYISCEACELDPFWAAATRFLLAGVIFAVIARAMRVEVPRGRALIGPVLFGIFQYGAGFGLIYWGLVRAPAGLSQVLVASVPLLTFGLALAHRQERFRWRGLLGAGLALGGTGVVFASGSDAGVPLTSMLAILGGAACWAEALVVRKAFSKVHDAWTNAIGMGVGTAILLVLTVIFDEATAMPREGTTWAAQAYLVLAGSVAVFALYLFVLRRMTASAASYQLVLIPLVTVVASAVLQDEQITASFAFGSVFVLVGVYVGIRRHVTER